MTEKDREYFKKNRLTLLLGLISLSFLIYFIAFSCTRRKLYRELESNGLIDTAVIIRDFIGAKRKLNYEYRFNVNDKIYNGFLQYSPSHGTVDIGDTFLVKYLRNDPGDINKLISDKYHLLIKPRDK